MNELELRDIHLPDAVSWWPPAIGWWVLLCVLIILILGLIFLIKKLKEVPVRSKAKLEFEKIKLEYQTNQDKTLLSQQLSQLLRQILLSSFERDQVASVTSHDWLAMLNQSHPKGTMKLEWLELITNSSYQKQADFDDIVLLKNIEQWINTYPRRHLL